jgi:RNase P/RNase MRP subunit p29
MEEVLRGAAGPAVMQRKVGLSDLHGCVLEVLDSKAGSDVGIRGIVIRESKSAFHLMTTADKVKIVSKKGLSARQAWPRRSRPWCCPCLSATQLACRTLRPVGLRGA